MARIHVTGNAGSGKSTLAAYLGRALDLPVYGLDQVVWQPGWRKTPADLRDELEGQWISQPAWVIEGVSAAVRQAADVIIFLDAPRRIAYWRCLKRNLPYAFRSRPGLPPQCPELRIAPRLAKLIWRFPRRIQPDIMQATQNSGGVFYHVRTSQDLAHALGKMGLHNMAARSRGGQYQ